MDTFTPMHDVHENGEVGPFKLERFEIGKPTMRMLFRPEEHIPPGKYVQLLHRGAVVMSDTPFEHRSNYTVVRKAQGEVFIAGLGIGMVLLPILRKPEVTRVTVVEKYEEVATLVLPGLKKALWAEHWDKLSLVLGDALEYQPPKGRTWDCIYFDIWNNVTTDSLEDIAKLKRRFARRKNEGAWIGAWMEDTLRYRRGQERRSGW